MMGIFGGTFDPIHYGHLRSALEVQQYFNLRELRLIPCAQPPHRQQPLTDAARRLDMVQLAIADSPELRCDARELQRAGASYTVDTLHALRQELGTERIILFIGADAFVQLRCWYRWQQLFDYAHIVVLTRPETILTNEFSTGQVFFTPRLARHADELQHKPAGLLYFHTVTALAISATAIRRLIATQGNPRFLLPDAVIAYINAHQLYQTRY